MKVSEAYGPNKFGLSFELFPPKTEKTQKALFKNLETLMLHQPAYVTCTYGAGGSTRDKTLEIITKVKEIYNCPVASHLTCVGSTADELRTYLTTAHHSGVDNIVALRGDPPQGETEFKPVAGGFSYANELVEFIKSEFPELGMAVAGYPEKHQEAPSMEIDLDNLKRKVDAGADIVITQLFYTNKVTIRCRCYCRRSGIILWPFC